MKNLSVIDEIFHDCVQIEGINYAKDYFRTLGLSGPAIGQTMRIIQRSGGVVSLEKIDYDSLLAENKRMREALERIASAKECDGDAEYGDWGNYDDVYDYGIERGFWLQAEIAKSALEWDGE